MADAAVEASACGDDALRWLRDLLTQAKLQAHLEKAAKWQGETGCNLEDLELEDTGAVVEVSQYLGLRKYEVGRLRRALGLSGSPTTSPVTSPPVHRTRTSSGDGSSGSGSPPSASESGSIEALGSPGPGAPGLVATRRGSGGRRRLMLQLPQVQEQEGSGVDGEGDGDADNAAKAGEGAWDPDNPMKIPDGLHVKNTFFQLAEDDAVDRGPATCPPQFQAAWSSTSSSPNGSPNLKLSLQDISATPSWSGHNTPSGNSRPNILSTQQKLIWSDCTPGCSTPTPIPQMGKASFGGGGGVFSQMLAAELAKEESDGMETDTTVSLRALSSSPSRHDAFEFTPPMGMPPPPSAFPQMFLFPPAQEMSPPPRSAAGRVRLNLEQTLGFQEANNARRNNGGTVTNDGPAAMRGRRSGGQKDFREPRRPAKKAAGSPATKGNGQPQPGVLIPEKQRPTRHRGSKEAKDPDRSPDDPFEGLPTFARIDLGCLMRSVPGTLEEGSVASVQQDCEGSQS